MSPNPQFEQKKKKMQSKVPPMLQVKTHWESFFFFFSEYGDV